MGAVTLHTRWPSRVQRCRPPPSNRVAEIRGDDGVRMQCRARAVEGFDSGASYIPERHHGDLVCRREPRMDRAQEMALVPLELPPDHRSMCPSVVAVLHTRLTYQHPCHELNR